MCRIGRGARVCGRVGFDVVDRVREGRIRRDLQRVVQRAFCRRPSERRLVRSIRSRSTGASGVGGTEDLLNVCGAFSLAMTRRPLRVGYAESPPSSTTVVSSSSGSSPVERRRIRGLGRWRRVDDVGECGIASDHDRVGAGARYTMPREQRGTRRRGAASRKDVAYGRRSAAFRASCRLLLRPSLPVLRRSRLQLAG